MSIVTLLTDFGTADYFVGAMKGALLSVNPKATIVDITHEVPAHDVVAGAFTLLAAFDAFPAGTIHLAVVDPGVGSPRRALIVEACGHTFVGPDNGLFGHVYERAGEYKVIHLTDERYFRRGVSATFHGRDLFAPVAGALSLGERPESFGEIVKDEVRLSFPSPRRLDDGRLEASIIHIDLFGNCVTNLKPEDLTAESVGRGASVTVNGRDVGAFRRFYAERAGAEGQPFIIPGSAGLLEISLDRGNAARLLCASRGQKVYVTGDK
jgi:S-adenosyl-L-methionine hydrolase (adenosine-forming)